MNEQYLFRGKRVDNGEWVQGFLAWDNFIITQKDSTERFENASDYEVDPDTVGRYTGLHGKNGTLIFAGDICECGGCRCDIVWGTGGWYFHYPKGSLIIKEHMVSAKMSGALAYEVIGNIHDTPELLKEV